MTPSEISKPAPENRATGIKPLVSVLVSVSFWLKLTEALLWQWSSCHPRKELEYTVSLYAHFINGSN